MYDSLILSLIIPSIVYFIVFKLVKSDSIEKCVICKEKLIDGVESLCGHFYCGIYYIGECLEENQCICGKKISLLFTEKMNKNIAWFNIDNASRSYTYIFYDSVYLMYKMIKDTKLYKWNLVWRSWGILLGIQYLSIEMYSLSVYWIIKVAIFCIIIEISIIFSSLAYFNAIITLSANFLSNWENNSWYLLMMN